MCGRTHFATESRDHGNYQDDNEAVLARYWERHAQDPDAYVAVNGHTVHYVHIDNATVPDDCPCNGLTKYENFMWNSRHIWSSYMMARKLALQAELDSIGSTNVP